MNTSFEVILPFLRGIEGLIKDPHVSEIMVNPDSRIFVEREGEVTEVPGVTIGEKNRQVAVRNIARTLSDEISEEKPLLDSRLPDGSRRRFRRARSGARPSRSGSSRAGTSSWSSTASSARRSCAVTRTSVSMQR